MFGQPNCTTYIFIIVFSDFVYCLRKGKKKQVDNVTSKLPLNLLTFKEVCSITVLRCHIMHSITTYDIEQVYALKKKKIR